MTVSQRVKVRVSEAVLFAVSGGDARAERALRARLAGASMKEAAAAEGIGDKRLSRMEALYQRSVSILGGKAGA